MKLLPETMGYVSPDDPKAIEKMMNNADMMGMTQDGMFAAFYHPYLGVDGFEELITKMEKLTNISWIDLKQMDQWVKVDHVDIHTDNGEIIVEQDRSVLKGSSLDVLKYYFNLYIDKVLWGMAIIGAAAVIAFIIFTGYLKIRKNLKEG